MRKGSDNLTIYCTGLGAVQGPNGENEPGDGVAAPADPNLIYRTTAKVQQLGANRPASVPYTGKSPDRNNWNCCHGQKGGFLLQVSHPPPPGATNSGGFSRSPLPGTFTRIGICSAGAFAAFIPSPLTSIVREKR
jgi:hypothetical protein